MANPKFESVLEALNLLAALVPDNHHWTAEERNLYNYARRTLTRLSKVA